jgi:hypothetical protein
MSENVEWANGVYISQVLTFINSTLVLTARLLHF